jgi:glycine/D-amino acid oxidase-like deaminating enzyme
MNRNPRTHGLWETTAPAGPSTQPLAADVNADVVVIGAGFTGCSAALHLAMCSKRVIVLEAADVGFGGSGRNVGLVNAGMWVMPEALPRQLGELHGERLLQQLGHAPALVFDLVERFDIDCQARQAGTLHCAVGSKGLQELSERARQWQMRGADVELLEGDRAHRLIGSTAYAGALLDRRAGTIQPLAYVRGLAHAAISQGASIHERSPALSREDLGDQWKVRTAQGSVTAPWIIVATDAYSRGIWSPIRTEQTMLPYFNLATAPLSPHLRAGILSEGQGAWDTAQVLSSFRMDSAGRLVFGSVGALRGPGTAIHRAWATRELARLFPELGRVSFEHQWYGMIGMTGDAIPRLHRIDRNIVSISAFNGRGIAPGTTFGRDLARLAVGEIEPADLALPFTDLSRAPLRTLRTLRTAFYEAGAQALHFAGVRF